MRGWPLLALGTLSGLGACALSAPPAEATLAAPRPAGADTGAELDRLTERAIEAARAAAGDIDLQVAAAACLFQAADLRLQQATVQWLDAHPEAIRSEVLSAEDQIVDPARSEILSLCTTGLEFADRAAAAAPQHVGALLHQGLHLSLIAWANGPARSLFAGYGPRLVKAIDAALALDPGFDHGAPLRLQGRFRGKAPWPYGDLAAAKSALARAVALASVPVNHLFYGDVLAASGDSAAAEAQWALAIEAPADDSTRWSAELLRELARRRLGAK